MKSPYTGKEMSLLIEERMLVFRKAEFKVAFHFYQCYETAEKFSASDLDALNMFQVHNQYRDRFNLPFPDEIASIRAKYDLPVTKMSEILGFGTNSYRHSESGEVPSNANGKLIQLAADPRKFRGLVEIAESLAPSYKENLLSKIDKLIRQHEEHFFESNLEDYFFYNKVNTDKLAGEFSGYKKPTLEKLIEMVVFFAHRLKPWKTQLNKLLFYADFLNFEKTCFSISGVSYRAIDMGPIVNNYNSIFEYLTNNDDVDVRCIEFSNSDTVGEQFVPHPDRACRIELFSETEMAFLEHVAERFKNTSTNEIIELSHNEKAWLENIKERKIISYKYAFDLSVI